MARVVLRPGESQEQLLRRFRRTVQRAGILSTVKKRRYFVPDSDKRRTARRKAERRERRRVLKAERRGR